MIFNIHGISEEVKSTWHLSIPPTQALSGGYKLAMLFQPAHKAFYYTSCLNSKYIYMYFVIKYCTENINWLSKLMLFQLSSWVSMLAHLWISSPLQICYTIQPLSITWLINKRSVRKRVQASMTDVILLYSRKFSSGENFCQFRHLVSLGKILFRKFIVLY